MKLINSSRIGVKFSLIMLAILILLVATVSIFAISEFSQLNNEQAVEQAIKGVGGLKQMIEDRKARAADIADLLAVNVSVLNGLRSDGNLLSAAAESVLATKKADFVMFFKSPGTLVYRSDKDAAFGTSPAESSDVQRALLGTSAAALSTDKKARLWASASSPVVDETGAIRGVVSVGISLDDSTVLDSLKEIFRTEMTIFLGDIRLSTTILKDGKRVLGTQLDPKITQTVITGKKTYSGNAAILGAAYITHYEPLGDDNGNVIGVIFAGQPVTDFLAARQRMILSIVAIAFIAITLSSLLINLIVKRSVSRPLASITAVADQLANGNINLSVGAIGKAGSKNEIDVLRRSFATLIDNIQTNALAAEKLAAGDFIFDLHPKSKDDILSHSLIQVKSVLQDLIDETRQLTQSTIAGQLSVRGQANRFQGGYRGVIEGFNQTLDAAIAPIQEAASVLHQVAAGRLGQTMTGQYQGEHAAIKNALNDTITALNRYIREIAHVLSEMANSNLAVGIENEYHGDFAPIKDALNLIIESFNRIFKDMTMASEQVESGSRQMANGSQILSQGASEQASSLDQLSIKIGDISGQTRENAKNAGKANSLAMTTHANAQAGSRRMDDLQLAMNEINESSASVAKIIKVIDDIAFQTNILALNAAVEAARAGSHGKGFAVVADEVRNLAAKSAKAASETNELIESTIGKTSAGADLADQTAREFRIIVDNVAQTADLIGAITKASDEQAGSIASINQNLSEVSTVVQTNSATAEETASTSEELSGQAELLKEMISQFHLA
jgi:methyl-accepting chemotaxis protein